MKSPCIKVCTLEDGICIGCFRTQDEIREWIIYTDEQKRVVLEKLEERKILHNINNVMFVFNITIGTNYF